MTELFRKGQRCVQLFVQPHFWATEHHPPHEIT